MQKMIKQTRNEIIGLMPFTNVGVQNQQIPKYAEKGNTTHKYFSQRDFQMPISWQAFRPYLSDRVVFFEPDEVFSASRICFCMYGFIFGGNQREPFSNM